MKRAENNSQLVCKYPEINFKVDAEFPIRILDSMIQLEEEQHNGFSLYNRGQNLKKSLINPDRVKEYLLKMEAEKTQSSIEKSVIVQQKKISKLFDEKQLISVNTVS